MAKFQRILLRAMNTWRTSSYTTFVVFFLLITMMVVVCFVKGVLTEVEELEVDGHFGGVIYFTGSGFYVAGYCCTVPRIISELIRQLRACGFTHLE